MAAQHLRARRPDLCWACDTHDVFFMLDRDANATERRFFFSARRQRKQEMRALASVDLAVAISASDGEALRKAGLGGRVCVDSGTFEHARVAPNLPAPGFGTFGYIGSGNVHNQNCLLSIMTRWWPEILAETQDARLRIAGGAAGTTAAKRLAEAFPHSIELLGFVSDLRDFYASVHTTLSPIAVQGGLNFKSVETLIAGRELLTTKLGARCLGFQEGIWIADDEPGGVAAAIRALRATPVGPERRAAVQAAALAKFGESAGFYNLMRWIFKKGS
jgi:hypothetical protein